MAIYKSEPRHARVSSGACGIDRDESAFDLFDPVAEGFGNPLNFDADNAQFATHLKPLPDLTDSDTGTGRF